MSDDRSPHSAPGDDPRSETSPSSPPTASFAQLAILVMALLATVYLVVNFIGDIGSWHLAAAEEHNLSRDRDDTNGELKLAIEAINAAIEADPSNLAYVQQRSLWRRDAGDYDGALADLQWIESHIPAGEGLEVRVNLMQLRGLIYQRQGKHKEAVAEQTEMIERLKRKYAGVEKLESYQKTMSWALNNRAYFRAIGNFGKADLEEALADIDQSLKLAGYVTDTGPLDGRDDEAMKRDTRGYIRYLLGDYEGALKDMERSILIAEHSYSEELIPFMEKVRTVVDRRPIRLHMRQYEEMLAVLYHHRGLVYDKLGRRHDAQVEFDRAKRLGYNPARGVF